MLETGIGRMYWDTDKKRLAGSSVVFNYVKNLVENIRTGQGIVFSGSVGVGKTTALCYIAKAVFSLGEITKSEFNDGWYPVKYKPFCTVKFASINHIFSLFFEKNRVVDEFKKCRLLLLDDFGREYQHDFPVSSFEDFVEYRYANLLPTIITTNLDSKQLREIEIYTRVVDRWSDKKLFKYVEIQGESQR